MSATLAFALSSGLLFAAIGAFGSLVELTGKIAQVPRIESAGRAIEAFAVDLPKLYSGVKNVVQGKNL